MKFTRRPDPDPRTRIHIVMLAYVHQGVYGKMTEIAGYYKISRTFLHRLIFMATLELETLFSDEKRLCPQDHRPMEPLILLLRLEGKCSLSSISEILKALEYAPDSVGQLSRFLQSHGHELASTVSMASEKWVFYPSDEIFALHEPILLTIDAQSTAILEIELASDRSAETWRVHFEALEDHRFRTLGLSSDRGPGLVGGYKAACEVALWVCDHFHEFRDLFGLLHQWERKAYAAMSKEYDAAQKFENAQSESHPEKRLASYEQAHQACLQAMARYDQLFLLLRLLRESLQICSSHGRLRTAEGVRGEPILLLQMIEALDHPAITHTLKPIYRHIDDIVVPFAKAEAIDAELRAVVPRDALDFLVTAWRHDHLFHQSKGGHKRYHQKERAFFLSCAEGLLDDAFDTLEALVFDKLDTIVRASSLVEMVNGLIRPYLNSCKGRITQETLNLIMFHHNHHRYESGERQGKAPMELLTGKPLEDPWWELSVQQVEMEQKTGDESLPSSRSALKLVSHQDRHTDQQPIAPARAIPEHTGAEENDLEQADSKAA